MNTPRRFERLTIGVVLLIGLICIAFGASGCAKVKHDTSVDASLSTWFARFEAATNVGTVGIGAKFATLSGDVVGQCWSYSDGYRLIEVDKPFWDSASDSVREELLFHELGHCALNRGHTSAKLANGCPFSIMYPYVFGAGRCYLFSRPYYFDELAHGSSAQVESLMSRAESTETQTEERVKLCD